VLDVSKLNLGKQTDQYRSVIQVIMITGLPAFIPQLVRETQCLGFLDTELFLVVERGALFFLD
jgi:hypothetical protein